MRPLRSFEPIASRSARLLILGSLPSVASLAAGEYYAHPRNQFWPILGDICGFDARAPYARRKRALLRCGIALWDVVGSGVRPGSLDAAIDDATVVANDFPAFLAAHPRIARVCFNGRKAESAWRRHVARQLPPSRKLDCRLLPSTSPAHAAMGYRRKLRIWQSALEC